MNGAWAWCLRLPCVAVILVCLILLLTERGSNVRD
jgi:hypothetical protein